MPNTGVLAGGLAALVLLYMGVLQSLPSDEPPRWRAVIGPIKADPGLQERIASRPRDASGLTGSGVTAQRHGASRKSEPSAYEGRLFRTGYTGAEPTLGVTGNGWIFYVAAQRDPNTDRLNSTIVRSKDGGASWQAVTAERPTLDPYLWVDPATDRVFSVDFVGCGLMSYSDDYGETWTDMPPVGCGHNTDHQTMYAGPPVTSATTGYPNVIYYCSIGGGALNGTSTQTSCSKSLDGGQSFLPTLTAPFPQTPGQSQLYGLPGSCNGTSGHIFVGADGTAYVPRGACDQPWLAISRDEGNTWTRVQVADTGMGRDNLGLWDHEAAVRADVQGNVYYSWVARDRIPYLAVSRDGGSTWSAPIRIAPPEILEAVLPNMDMDAQGRLAFIYMGSTNSPGAPFPNDSRCVIADDPATALNCPALSDIPQKYAEVTWDAYVSVTANPLEPYPAFDTAPINDPDDPLIRGECGPFRCQAEYDFIDVEFGPQGEIVAAVIDACDPDSFQCTAVGEAVMGKLVLAGTENRAVATAAQAHTPKSLFGGAMPTLLCGVLLLAGLWRCRVAHL